VAYLTDLDIDAEPAALRGARAYVSMGHEQYWSPNMRRRVRQARDEGTNLTFLGANTMFWRVRVESLNSEPLVVGYRADADVDPVGPRQQTGRFRDISPAESENTLTGMQYECFPVDAPYRVDSPGWWGFRGTHARYGATYDHIVWVEADRAYPLRTTPGNLQVLSYATYSCNGVRTVTNSSYYTAPSGAGVFDAGTLRWSCPCGGGVHRGTCRVEPSTSCNR